VDEIASGATSSRAADGPQEGRLLVRLAARHRRDAQAYPYNNATSIQVCAPFSSASSGRWRIRPRHREADEMDFARNLEICMPYLGPVVGKYSDWTPLAERGQLFPEDIDKSDPGSSELPRRLICAPQSLQDRI